MQWNDSINNEGDLSCSSHNLHFKAHKDTITQREESRQESPLTPIFTELPITQSQRHTLAHKLALCFSALWCHRSHNPCHSAPSHAEIAEQRAVKGVCALSLGGIKDVESCHAFPPASSSLWADLKFSLPNKRSWEDPCRVVWILIKADDIADKTGPTKSS